MTPTGGTWTGSPVKDGLDTVSHSDLGYTGEIDVYEIEMPAPGRLQVSLAWQHDADFDLIVAADSAGKTRIATGDLTGSQPEYLGLDVAAGQRLYLFVAGWDGTPGDYTLETILLPPGSAPFDFELGPDVTLTAPANADLSFGFNAELDPGQTISDELIFVTSGHFAEGRWCIHGDRLVFHPRMPVTPSDEGGLHIGSTYTVQFPRGARGLRAITGEYLSEVHTVRVTAETYADEDPGSPPRVTNIDWNPGTLWTGAPITLSILGRIDPATAFAQIRIVALDGTETPFPTQFTLDQPTPCSGSRLCYLAIEPAAPLPPQSRLRLRVPGTVLELGGSAGVTGPAPALAGAGFAVDLRTP